MKILIFSDTHFTKFFDKNRYDHLVKIITESDKVIINGDFWDSIVCTFDEFISSPWSGLFPLLKKKNAIYIYGNHDPKKKCDERTSLFSVIQKLRHNIKLGNDNFIIEHGDKITGDFNTKFPMLNHRFDIFYKIFFHAYTSKITIIKKIAQYIMALDKKDGQKCMIEKFPRYAQENKSTFIFGHTHIQLDNRDNGFITTGAITPYKYQYIVVDDVEEKITLF